MGPHGTDPDPGRSAPHRARPARVVARGRARARRERRAAVRRSRRCREAPTLSLNELAARTRTHQSTVSVVVKRLVERGPGESGTSRRSTRAGVELALTGRGRALLATRAARRAGRLIDGIEQAARRERQAAGRGAARPGRADAARAKSRRPCSSRRRDSAPPATTEAPCRTPLSATRASTTEACRSRRRSAPTPRRRRTSRRARALVDRRVVVDLRGLRRRASRWPPASSRSCSRALIGLITNLAFYGRSRPRSCRPRRIGWARS